MEKQSIKFSGQIIQVECRSVELPNGKTLQMEAVIHPGGAAVVAVNDRQEICLLKQYRPVFDAWLWELPAGKIDDSEPPLETAQRELQEEAGLVAEQWQSLGHMISSPGVFSEMVHLYAATGLTQQASAIEEHEVFEVHWLSLEEALSMIANNEITDAKTVIALQKYSANMTLL